MDTENRSLPDVPAGRTYSLPEGEEYFTCIARQVDKLVSEIGGPGSLDTLLTERIRSTPTAADRHDRFEELFAPLSAEISAAFTSQLNGFLISIAPDHPDHETFSITERGYHLRMLHIEIMNRIMRNAFLQAKNKVIILPHCLRDFREEDCLYEPGDVDHICLGCTNECLVNITGTSLSAHAGYHLYISVEQDLEKVFETARQLYEDAALLGVACVPELYQGMLLSRRMGIPAQGVLLNYNRCRRWMGTAQPTSFNLQQLLKAAGILQNERAGS